MKDFNRTKIIYLLFFFESDFILKFPLGYSFKGLKIFSFHC